MKEFEYAPRVNMDVELVYIPQSAKNDSQCLANKWTNSGQPEVFGNLRSTTHPLVTDSVMGLETSALPS